MTIRGYQCAPGSIPTKAMPVFYNPRMILNRDLTIVFLHVVGTTLTKPLVVSDPLAGSGVRSVRVAKEVPNVHKILANDLNPKAVAEIHQNVALNECTSLVEVSARDARVFLNPVSETNPHYVDVDPFGSPREYLLPALSAIHARAGYLGITATDTAVLCGAQRGKCLKNYMARAIPGEICKEVGLRVLLGFVVRQAASLEFAIEPLLSFVQGHFFRLFVRVTRGARAAQRGLKNLGYVRSCPACLFRDHVPQYPALTTPLTCPSCGHALRYGGPLWVAALHDPPVISQMREAAEGPRLDYLQEGRRVRKLLARCAGEVDLPPYYFNLHVLADRLQLPVPACDAVIAALVDQGYPAARTHFDPRAIKSAASTRQVERVLTALVKD